MCIHVGSGMSVTLSTMEFNVANVSYVCVFPPWDQMLCTSPRCSIRTMHSLGLTHIISLAQISSVISITCIHSQAKYLTHLTMCDIRLPWSRTTDSSQQPTLSPQQQNTTQDTIHQQKHQSEASIHLSSPTSGVINLPQSPPPSSTNLQVRSHNACHWSDLLLTSKETNKWIGRPPLKQQPRNNLDCLVARANVFHPAYIVETTIHSK